MGNANLEKISYLVLDLCVHLCNLLLRLLKLLLNDLSVLSLLLERLLEHLSLLALHR